MKIVTFKTNIKCSGCVAKATPFLNDAAGIEAWEVDTTHPDKILMVTTELSAEQIKEKVIEAGFQAEPIVSH
ncbi:MAG: hypothetical protein V4651_00245 [Bacteroidota bacterium]